MRRHISRGQDHLKAYIRYQDGDDKVGDDDDDNDSTAKMHVTKMTDRVISETKRVIRVSLVPKLLDFDAVSDFRQKNC